MIIQDIHGFSFFLTRPILVFFLLDKADTYDTFKKFITRAENEFELKVKKV